MAVNPLLGKGSQASPGNRERGLEMTSNDQEQPRGQSYIAPEIISRLMGILLVTDSRIHTSGKSSEVGCVLTTQSK